MTKETKITLSSKELELICNSDWILTKHIIIDKVYQLFGKLAVSMQERVRQIASTLPREAAESNPKISRGENYRGLPYVMLDYPRHFTKESTLAMRTFFNMLGPMVNPATPKFQLVGVYNLEMARVYNYLLQLTGKAFTIIHGLDGYDEISLTNDTKVITNKGEKIMTPEELGKRMVSPADISGGNSVEEAAKIFSAILKGEGTWAQNAVVLANAAMALNCTGKYKNYDAAYNAAVDSLENGKANSALKKLISLQ